MGSSIVSWIQIWTMRAIVEDSGSVGDGINSGGHPLFTTELLRELQERGDLVEDENGHWMADHHLNWEFLPPRSEGVIAERLSHLPSEWRGWLRAASVQGKTFVAETLARVVETNEAEVIKCLSGVLSNHLRLAQACGVQKVGNRGASTYQFRYALYQRYLYRSLDAVEQAHLQTATSRVLKELYGSQRI